MDESGNVPFGQIGAQLVPFRRGDDKQMINARSIGDLCWQADRRAILQALAVPARRLHALGVPAVEMPVEQPSACMFGGADLSTLYITSAWEDLSEEARAAQPLAGSLFACEPGVTGLPLPLFDG